MDFEDILGHDMIKKSFKSAIKTGNISHSYIFEGPRGSGKKMMAKVLGKTLLCEKAGETPCNRCPSCLKFDTENHPDFYTINPEGNSFKKDKIELLQKEIMTKPYEGKRKIFILEDGDKMTLTAQNKFLKTLEEPPNYVIIIIICKNSGDMLPTILSRSQLIRFSPVNNDMIIDMLVKNYDISKENALILTAFSHGLVGRAIKLVQSEYFKTLREDTLSIIMEIMDGDKIKVFTRSDFFQDKKEEIGEILDILLLWFRDLLLIKSDGHQELIINRDKLDKLNYYGNTISVESIYDIIDTITATKEDIKSNISFQLAIETMLLKIQEVKNIW